MTGTETLTDENDPSSSPPSPGDKPEEEIVSADELAAVMEEASSVARELAQEVGVGGDQETTAPAAPQAEGAPGGPSPEEVADGIDLDARLSELERLVETASRELGGDLDRQEPVSMTDLSRTGMSPGEASSPSSPAAEDAPDFMAEFMEGSEEEKNAPEPQPVPAAPSPTISAPVTSPKPGVVSTPDLAPAQPEEKVEETEEEPAEPSAGLGERIAGMLKPMTAVVSGLALHAADKGVTVLELVDKPLARFGDTVRRIVGWVGLATLGAALMLYMVSLL
ncbi:MAG: hypothetical protein D6788_10110 [Planctomycetota bacterium]|nr:MAG: hypothetical protein D6788_10110 [Planctomycetota bacterium]